MPFNQAEKIKICHITSADIEDILLSYTKAANDLREAYLIAFNKSSNLPPYEELVAADKQ